MELNPDLWRRALELQSEYDIKSEPLSRLTIGKILEVSESEARGIFYALKNRKIISQVDVKSYSKTNLIWKENTNAASLSGFAVDAETLIKRYNVDMNVWEFDRMEVKENAWDVTMRYRDKDLKYDTTTDNKGNTRQIIEGNTVEKPGGITKTNTQKYIKVSFKRRKEVFDHEKFKKDLADWLVKFTPEPINYKVDHHPDGEYMLEIDIFDLHLDKLGWHGETDMESYDYKIARVRFLEAVKAHLDNVKDKKISKILFPIGNDFFNADVDYPYSSTTRKTPQQSDLRWQKSFHIGWKLIVEAIEMCKKVAHVEVIDIPGNHDFQKAYYLGEVISVYYGNDSMVTVNNSPNPRKYIKFGKNLIGFTHGNPKDISLPRLKMLMQQEKPVEWGDTFFREWHLGDIHHSKKIELIEEDDMGLQIRYLKSLAGQDAWHHNKGYHSIKGAESFLWHKDNGMVDNFHYNIRV